MKLAVIGTAGRSPDDRLLTAAHWRMACIISQVVAETLGARHLVSGGSAWMDHTCVQLYLDGVVGHLKLHLPCHFQVQNASFDQASQEGRRLNDLHMAFHQRADSHSVLGIAAAIRKGAEIHVNPGGFKARNTDVANEADALLAFTFSGGALPKDGGTRDTWEKFRARSDKRVKEAEAQGAMFSQLMRLRAFHFDLVTRRFYEDHYNSASSFPQRRV